MRKLTIAELRERELDFAINEYSIDPETARHLATKEVQKIYP